MSENGVEVLVGEVVPAAVGSVSIPDSRARELDELRRLVVVRDEEITRLRTAVVEQTQRATTAERRVEDLNDAAIEWADDNNLCSEFENFCENYGLRGRNSEYSVTLSVTVQVQIEVEGKRGLDRYDLADRISHSDVRGGRSPTGAVENGPQAEVRVGFLLARLVPAPAPGGLADQILSKGVMAVRFSSDRGVRFVLSVFRVGIQAYSVLSRGKLD